MLKGLLVGIGFLFIALLTGCSKPISAIYLSYSKIIYAVESPVYADSIKVKDLRGNTFCFKKNVDLTPPQTSVNLGFCSITDRIQYEIETKSGKNTYTNRVYGSL